VVKELLSDAGRRSCLKALNRDGATPLHLAVQSGLLDIARLLVNAGAKVDATDRVREGPECVWIRVRGLSVCTCLGGCTLFDEVCLWFWGVRAKSGCVRQGRGVWPGCVCVWGGRLLRLERQCRQAAGHRKAAGQRGPRWSPLTG
jgi:hypothetical protein